MSKLYKAPKHRPAMLATGRLIGVGVSALLFLAIPLTQIFTDFDKEPNEIEALNLAPPPPPPPPTDPPEPPEPEEEEPPPELDTPPPPISLEQLDMALNPGTGGATMAGDFALPTFDVNSSDLGSLDIFELGDVDSPPTPRTRIEFNYPSAAKRRGITGTVRVEYIVNEEGRVQDIKITESPDRLLSDATMDTLRRARFDPATKGGRPVKVRMRASIPYR